MAALDLVSEVALDAPELLIADDAQWLDRPTLDVLAFVARRIESDPILLAAICDGYPSVLGDAGLPQFGLAGLDDATAGALLDIASPELSLASRNRVPREAAGNPLDAARVPSIRLCIRASWPVDADRSASRGPNAGTCAMGIGRDAPL
jgi:hypothetical protein